MAKNKKQKFSKMRPKEKPKKAFPLKPTKGTKKPRGTGAPRRRVTLRAAMDAEAAIRSVFELFQHPEYAGKSLGDVLSAVVRSVEDPFAGLTRMMMHGRDAYLVESAMQLLYFTAEHDDVPGPVRELAQHSAVNALNEALRDERVDDSRKYDIAPLLALLGAEIPHDEFVACFKDYQEPKDDDEGDGLNDLAERLADDLEGLSAFMARAHLDRQPKAFGREGNNLENAYHTAATLCQARRDLGAWAAVLTVAFAIRDDLCDERAIELLDLASSIYTPATAWMLETLGSLPGGGEEAAHALTLANQMIEDGVSPRPLDTGRFVRALVSQMDGGGTRTLFIYRHRPNTEEWAAAVFVLTKTIGIKDAFWILKNVDEEQEDIAASMPSIAYERCDMARARELIDEALAVQASRDAPVPGRVLGCLQFLWEEE